jgi:hypothetical protein
MNFAHPLDGPRGKLVRAKQHAVALAECVQAYLDGEPLSFEVRYDASTRSHIAHLRGEAKPPLYLGAILGDVAHNLRSGLDQVAWALACAHSGMGTIDGAKDARRIVFPIISEADQFARAPAIRYVSDDAAEALAPWQPYQNQGTPRMNPLAVLQALSNTDKHRVLTPSLAGIDLANLDVTTTVPFDVERIEPIAPDMAVLEDDAPVFRVPVAQESAEIHVSLGEPPAISFPIEVASVDVLLSVEQVLELVHQITDVIESFQPFFPPTGMAEWPAREESWLTPGYGGVEA